MSTRQGLLLRHYGLPLAAWLLTATLVACNDGQVPGQVATTSTSTSTSASTQPAAAQAGGVLKIALEGDPQCLDPQQAGNNTALNIGRQVVDSLTDQDPNSGAIVPWLAQSWEVDPQSRRFSFTLRQDARFSDGSAVDAAAVKANFENILALGGRSILGSTYLAGLKSITTPAPYEVVVEFEQPNTQFLQASSTMSLGLLAPATLARSAGERCQGQLIGSGPFTLQGYVLNQRVTLKRRTDYAWASSLAGHQGPAWLEGVEWLIVPESGVRLGALASGQVHVNSAVAPQDEASVAQQGLLLLTRANPGVVFNLAPNEKHGVFSDLRVRQAFNKAINRAELQSISSAQQKAATALLASSTPYYRDFSPLLAYDPKGARQLLDAAGWQLGADGIRHKDGQRLSVRLDYWQATLILELVQQQLRQVGIELQLNKSTLAQVTALQASGDYSLRFLNLTRADPDVLRTLFDASGYNLNQRPVSEVDQWLQASAQTLDHEQRQALIDQASERLLRDGHAIALLELTTVIAHSQAVRGLHYEASSRLQLYDTWLAE